MDIPFLHITLPELIQSIGYVGVFLMVYVESGVPIGLFIPLPGDTLLFSAGMIAAHEAFALVPLIITIVVAAILGDSTGYWFGAKYGARLFEKEGRMFFNKRTLDRTIQFYAKYGKSALVIARFLPIFRTLVPIFAGVGGMRYATFFAWNVLGALVWGVSITMLGYYLGSMIPNIDTYLFPILLVVVVLSVGSAVREVLQEKKHAANSV